MRWTSTRILPWLLALGLGLVACEDEPLPPSVPSPGNRPNVNQPQPDPFAPRRTRSGHLRISTEQVHDNPAATPVLLERLDRSSDSELRVALVEALPRTAGAWTAEVLARLPDEADPLVRKAMVATMKRADTGPSVQGIGLGLDDPDDEVRTEAALVAGSLSIDDLRAASMLPVLIGALGDEHGPVRGAAARSLGILRAAEAGDALARLQDDQEAEVRRQAARALERLER